MNEHPASISALPVIPAPPPSSPRLISRLKSIDAFAAEHEEAA